MILQLYDMRILGTETKALCEGKEHEGGQDCHKRKYDRRTELI